MLLSLNHTLVGYSVSALSVVTLRATLTLYSPTLLFTPLTLKTSSISLTAKSKGRDGYVIVVVPIDVAEIAAITDRVTGNARLVLNSVTSDGTEYSTKIIDQSISDFRYDSGANKSSASIVLRGDYSTPIRESITQTGYISKKKLANTLVEINTYVYRVNPNDYRLYSIDAPFTDGIVTGVVSAIALNMLVAEQVLTIEVEEPV